jgi:hypothetical protein
MIVIKFIHRNIPEGYDTSFAEKNMANAIKCAKDWIEGLQI